MLAAAFAVVALVASSVVAQTPDPAINTPTGVTQCAVTSLTFSGTRPPFDLDVIPGGQPTADRLFGITQTSTSPYAWRVNVTQGTSITLRIRDSQGNLQFSSPITVQGSSDASCLGAGGSQPPSSSATGVSSTSDTSSVSMTSTSVPASNSPSTTTTNGSNTSTRASTTSSAAPSGTTTGAASALRPDLGALGLAGLLGAVLLG